MFKKLTRVNSHDLKNDRQVFKAVRIDTRRFHLRTRHGGRYTTDSSKIWSADVAQLVEQRFRKA